MSRWIRSKSRFEPKRPVKKIHAVIAAAGAGYLGKIVYFVFCLIIEIRGHFNFQLFRRINGEY